MKTENRHALLAAVAIVLVYLAAALIEPCDGHSCDQPVTATR